MTTFQGRVLVVGANGETGQRVVTSLQTKSIPTRALVRSQDKAQALQSPGIEIVIGDPLSQSDLQKATECVTAIINTLGTREMQDLAVIEAVEYTATLSLIDAAKATGVSHIVLCSSMGTDTPERIPPLVNILRAKRRAEETLMQSGIPYTIVHPGGLRNEQNGQGVLLQPHPGPIFGTISRDDTAEVLVQALLQPQASNRSIDIINQPGQKPATASDLFE